MAPCHATRPWRSPSDRRRCHRHHRTRPEREAPRRRYMSGYWNARHHCAVGLRSSLFRAVTGLHAAVFQASKGRLLGRAAGMPVVILTTTGHRSGRRRRTMLTAPVIDGARVVLVASYGGHSHNPHWFQNLLTHPDVGLVMGGKPERRMRARVAGPEERMDLWPSVVAAYPGYERYQQRTDRRIPLVVLEPYAVGR